jgi:hypothetical protein
MSDDIDTKIQSARDDALASLNEVIEQARYKSLGDGRIRSPEKEKIRLKYLRVIISAQDTRRKMLADKELEELRERLQEIEEHHDGVTV